MSQFQIVPEIQKIRKYKDVQFKFQSYKQLPVKLESEKYTKTLFFNYTKSPFDTTDIIDVMTCLTDRW